MNKSSVWGFVENIFQQNYRIYEQNRLKGQHLKKCLHNMNVEENLSTKNSDKMSVSPLSLYSRINYPFRNFIIYLLPVLQQNYFSYSQQFTQISLYLRISTRFQIYISVCVLCCFIFMCIKPPISIHIIAEQISFTSLKLK